MSHLATALAAAGRHSAQVQTNLEAWKPDLAVPPLIMPSVSGRPWVTRGWSVP